MDYFFIFSAKYLFVLLPIILGIYFLRLPAGNKKNMAMFALSALALTYIIGLISGYLYFDPRPFVVGNFTPFIPHASDNGFPSDHTLLVSALAMIGLYWNRKLGILLWIFAIIVGIARVYVGVHHTVDIIGAMVIAVIATSLVFVVNKKFLKKSELIS